MTLPCGPLQNVKTKQGQGVIIDYKQFNKENKRGRVAFNERLHT
jgi:hypothetical protein